MADHVVRLEVSGMPEVLAYMRHAIAQLLRDEAEGEPELVRKKLLQLAADFEVGLNESSE